MLTLALLQVAAVGFVFLCLVQPVYKYFKDPKGLRQYATPSIAGFTNIWMMFIHYTKRRNDTVHNAHEKYGEVVRLGPNHLSFRSPEAVKDIYGHGTAAFKDKFYYSFQGTHTQLLDTLDKEEHARKRKLFAAAFSQKSVEEKEHSINGDIQELIDQWDKLCTAPPAPGQSVFRPDEMTDARRWINLLMLDLACDFSFGLKVNFVHNGDDLTTCETIDGHKYQAHPEAQVDGILQHISTLGFAPPELLEFNKKLFAFHRGVKGGQIFTDWMIYLIRSRFAVEGDGEKRSDFFEGLNYTRDGVPTAMDMGELIQECGLLVNAGSETTTCALQNAMFYLIRNPRVMQTLHEELASAFDEDDVIPAYDKIKFLPYLRAVIDETLRHRPSLSIGLPRATPPEGMNVAGRWIPGETTISVPTWSLHHDASLFERPFEYLPERWLGDKGAELQKAFIPFSTGARACVGRNMAYMELSLILASWVRRYHFALASPEWQPTIHETMVIRSGPMPVKIWRRHPEKV